MARKKDDVEMGVSEVLEDEVVEETGEAVVSDESEVPVEGDVAEAVDDKADEAADDAAKPEAEEAHDGEAKQEQGDQMVTEDSAEAKKPSRRRRKKASEDDGIVEASRKELRERKRELGSVFTKDPKSAGAPVDPIHQDFLELAASQKNRIVRTGELSAVSVNEDGYAIAKIKYGHFVVMIPASHLFTMSENSIKEGGVNNSYAYYAQKRIGAPIDFIVEHVDESKKFAVASRLAAMQQISKHYYVEKHGEEPFLTPGKVVEGTIVYKMETGIGVEVFGAETFIYNAELSWNHFSDARREDYNVGQSIVVKILEVQNIDYKVGDRTYQLIGLKASARQATADPNEEYYDAIQVGDVSTGVITNVEAKTGYFVVLDAWPRTIVCQFTQSDRVIPVGSKVVVKIARKMDENKWIFGRITDILKTPDVSWY